MVRFPLLQCRRTTSRRPSTGTGDTAFATYVYPWLERMADAAHEQLAAEMIGSSALERGCSTAKSGPVADPVRKQVGAETGQVEGRMNSQSEECICAICIGRSVKLVVARSHWQLASEMSDEGRSWSVWCGACDSLLPSVVVVVAAEIIGAGSLTTPRVQNVKKRRKLSGLRCWVALALEAARVVQDCFLWGGSFVTLGPVGKSALAKCGTPGSDPVQRATFAHSACVCRTDYGWQRHKLASVQGGSRWK